MTETPDRHERDEAIAWLESLEDWTFGAIATSQEGDTVTYRSLRAILLENLHFINGLAQ